MFSLQLASIASETTEMQWVYTIGFIEVIQYFIVKQLIAALPKVHFRVSKCMS